MRRMAPDSASTTTAGDDVSRSVASTDSRRSGSVATIHSPKAAAAALSRPPAGFSAFLSSSLSSSSFLASEKSAASAGTMRRPLCTRMLDITKSSMGL